VDSPNPLAACSGAASHALSHSFKGQDPQGDQLAAVTPAPDLVTLTMGGNDLGFSDVVGDCYVHNCISDGTIAGVESKLRGEKKLLEADYALIEKKDSSATIMIVGYPRIFEDQTRCGGINTKEEKALNVLTGQVDGTIASAAVAEHDPYVSDIGVLAGHEMCSAHPWHYEIGFLRGLLGDQQQAHPNARPRSHRPGR